MKGHINQYKVTLLVVCFILLVNSNCKPNNQGPKKQSSRFDRAILMCKGDLANSLEAPCKDRRFDDNCIFKCVHQECFEKIYEGDIIEFGEIDMKKKNRLEACYMQSTRLTG